MVLTILKYLVMQYYCPSLSIDAGNIALCERFNFQAQWEAMRLLSPESIGNMEHNLWIPVRSTPG